MRIVHQAAALLRALFRSPDIDADLADEMHFHIERETEANIARGMTPDEARRAARLRFGSVDDAHESARDSRPGAMLRQLVSDVRIGTRLLLKAPAFAFTAIAIVVLGIGSAAAIFSVVYGVMLRPLPFHEPGRLVSIWLQRNGARNLPAAADAIDLRQLRHTFDDVALFQNANLNLIMDGEPQRLQGADVSANLFSMLGVSPARGRTFLPDEDQPGRPRVVLLSDPLWRGTFAADPGVLGRAVRINDSLYTVVGVMPPSFAFPSGQYQAWVPHVISPGELTRAETDNYRIVARLANGVTIDAARREVAALVARLMTTTVKNDKFTMTVDPLLDDVVRDIRPALTLLLGAVLFVLLIACVNLSLLFGARASARRAEFAVRLALGASRKRVIVQAIAEATPVLLAGDLLGVVAAYSVVRLFVATAPVGVPRVEDVGASVAVIVFSLIAVGLTAIAASIVPALQAWKSDFTAITKDGGRSATVGRVRARARNLGVAAQIAFALPLLVGASLLIRSAINVAHVPLGFRADGVATLSLEVARTRHPTDRDVADYYARLVDAARAIPGVTSAALVNRIPLLGGQTNGVHFETATNALMDHGLTNVDSRTVTPDYFTTLGIRLIAGRTFTEHDDANAPWVVIVDERLARTMWPGESAIGKRFREPSWRGSHLGTVIGVVAHLHTTGIEVDPQPQVYWSYRQWTQDRMVLTVHTAVPPASVIASVIQAVRSVDREQSVFEVHTMSDVVDRSLLQRRLTTFLMVGFSGVALLLAAIGIYGVVAYGVTQRAREFGIRVALGATRRDVTRLVVGQGTSMAMLGSAVGLVIAIAAAGAMRHLVYEVPARDALSLIAATALLMLVAGAASYVPARRASAADPVVTLRAD